MPIQLYDLAAADSSIMFSPFSWRIRMALLHKQLAFDVVPWRFSDRSATSAHGFESIPVICDGERWVGDSWEIAQYLDHQYPQRPPLMKDEESRAAARLVTALCGTLVFPSAIRIAVFQAWKILDPHCQPYFRESREAMFGATLEDLNATEADGRAGLAAALRPFSETLETSDFLGGDAPAYSDYTLFGVLKWADIVSTYPPLDQASAVGQWFSRLGAMYNGYAAQAPTVRG